MKYILDRRFRLRGWQRAPYGLYDTAKKAPEFLPKEFFLTLMRCDGAHDLCIGDMDEATGKFFQRMLDLEVIRPAFPGEFLSREQAYLQYPARYKRNAHWSITGACNLKCRHCFMSAPHAKHGNPSHEQLLNVVEQLAECGIFQVGLTGGEPLIREDLIDIIKALHKKEIGIDVIYTNGWLVDEQLLDTLDELYPDRKVSFQLSFDGIGTHDFLRGVPGAEKRTLEALALLKKKGHQVNISLCLHRGNMDTVRESVKLMASLGVRSMKVSDMLNLGEWMDPELRTLEITPEEQMTFFEQYIPQYFEDDAPLSIMLSGMFIYTPGENEWSSFFVKPCTPEERNEWPSCGSLINNFYIGADGVAAPCMGMADCGFASNFPNLYTTPLKDILGDSDLMKYCNATVSDVQNGNDECLDCAYRDRCGGGCRNNALMEGDNYYGADHDACWFFRHHGEERIKKAAENAFTAYLARHPEYNDTKEDLKGDL